MIGRRDLITLVGGAAVAWPLAARAQQQAMTRVGVVTIQPRTAPMYAAFDQRLRELGYVEGQNLALDYVNPEHRGIAGAIEELLRRKVDIILVTYESTLKAALAASVTVPIVMVAVDYDPLALGYVKSLARPGGNVTGINFFSSELAAKRIQLLHEMVRAAARVAMLSDPTFTLTESQVRDAETAARTMGIQIQVLNASTTREINAAFANFVRERPDALYVGASPFFVIDASN
jgi:putative ABC transport system substrate-binding protein